MSVPVLIEAVESEGFGGGGVVASAFGDVQVAGVLDGRDGGGPDGGQVGGPAAGPAGRGIFAEGHVADMVVRLDGPVLADEAGQVLRGGVGAGQAGDGVDEPGERRPPRALRFTPAAWFLRGGARAQAAC
jgi:hypothetical protein